MTADPILTSAISSLSFGQVYELVRGLILSSAVNRDEFIALLFEDLHRRKTMNTPETISVDRVYVIKVLLTDGNSKYVTHVPRIKLQRTELEAFIEADAAARYGHRFIRVLNYYQDKEETD